MGRTELLLVRHGESAGNVAQSRAESSSLEVIDVDWRDADAPLTERGHEQAAALGHWLGERGDAVREVWSSPYLRARDTARIALRTAGMRQRVRLDERLRDRELGVLDRLTSAGVRTRLPEESARRQTLGKMYYRPPGGESWADVALRLRSFLCDLDIASAGTVLVSCHDAVILLFRYILEELDEARLLELDRASSVGNASVTRLVRTEEGWELADFGAVHHLRDTTRC
ncbi:MAG TPA: histidine phosphatase family protein [Jatrophihabitantaceae bacterium]|jgi:broad specificity phosphatase PhoE